MVLNGFTQPLGGNLSGRFIGFRQQQHKFFAANTRRHVGLAFRCLTDKRDGLQD